MPPVGMKRMSGYGPERALSAPTPPIVSAGKNFSVVTPSDMASSISVGVATPGTIGTPRLRTCSTTRRIRARRDDELRTGVDRGVGQFGGEHGASANEDISPIGHGADCRLGCGGAEGDFGNGKAAADEGICERCRMFGMINDD